MAFIQWFLGTIAVVALLFLLPGCNQTTAKETTAKETPIILDWDFCIEISNAPMDRKSIFRCTFKNEVCYLNTYDYNFQCFKNSEN